MAIIPKETIEEIRSRCDIVEVVGSYLPALRRRGSTFKCNCPFHQEKTPSFTLNEARQIYHCFGCGAGGDVFRFVMEYEKVDFVTAVKILAERAGLEIHYEDNPDRKGPAKDALYKLHEEATSFFFHYLQKAPQAVDARRYLQERELSEDLIKAFRIGFAPNEWEAFFQHALKKGFSEEQLEVSGLAVPSERNGKKGFYDRFRNRVMFPIGDTMGRVIGFSGRIINQADKSAKYVNSPETPLFRKNQVLFAFDKARKPMVEQRQAIVVEGQIDAIRCHQVGLNNVVASQGTALTDNHARLLRRYADEVVLVLDADAAGLKAALASSEVFVAAELGVRVVALPEGEDPDSLLLKRGKEALTSLIQTAPSALDFMINHLSKQEDITTETGKMRVVKAVIQLISRSPSAARRDTMLRQAADRLDLSAQAMEYDLAQLLRQRQRTPSRVQEDQPAQQPSPAPSHPLEEVALLELLVHHYEEAHPIFHEYLRRSHFSDPICAELFIQLLADPPEALLEGFHDFDESTQRLISRIQIEESRTLDQETPAGELAAMYTVLLWRRKVENDIAQLARRADLSSEERYIERARLVQIKKSLETEPWEEGRETIAAYLATEEH